MPGCRKDFSRSRIPALFRHRRGTHRYRLPIDASHISAKSRRRAQGSCGRLCRLYRRRHRHQSDQQYRPNFRRLEAARASAMSAQRTGAASARPSAKHPRRKRLLSTGTEYRCRRDGLEKPVSIYTAEPGHRALYRPRPSCSTRFRAFDMLRDVTSDLQITNPQLSIDVDRDKAAALGLTEDQIQKRALQPVRHPPGRDALYRDQPVPGHPRERSELSEGRCRTLRRLIFAPLPVGWCRSRRSPKIRPSIGPLQINHLQQLPSVTISFNLKPGVALGDAVEAIQKLERDSNLPASISTGFQGTAAGLQGFAIQLSRS